MKHSKSAAKSCLLSGRCLLIALPVFLASCLVLRATAQEDSNEIADAGLSNQVIATVSVGDGPHVVVVNPKGDFVYVANYLGNTVSVIDTQNNTLVNTFSAGASPDGLAITPNGTELYVANNVSSGTVTILNAATGAIVNTVTVGEDPRFLSISPNGKLAYVANEDSGTISVIDTKTQKVTTSITIGLHASSATFSTNGKLAYACEDFASKVFVIDTAHSAIAHTIDTAEDPLYCVVNPKGGDVYIDNFNIATISVIKNNKAIKTFLPGEVPSVPAVTPNGKYLYIPNYYISGTTAGNTVSVFSTKTYTQVGSSITVGKEPSFVAINKKGDLAYVTNYEDDTVSVISISPKQ